MIEKNKKYKSIYGSIATVTVVNIENGLVEYTINACTCISTLETSEKLYKEYKEYKIEKEI